MEKAKKIIRCIYCGAEISRKAGTETKDHVPPKKFFEEPYPPNLKWVPACQKCNNSFGLTDEYIRVIFLLWEDVNGLDKYPKLSDSVVRTFKYGQPFWEKFYKDIKRDAGRAKYRIDTEKLNIFFPRLIKAFLFLNENKYFTRNLNITGFSTFNYKKEQTKDKQQIIDSILFHLKDLPFIEASPNIKYKYIFYSENQKCHSLWCIKLFDVLEMVFLIENAHFQEQKYNGQN